jgi:hypothetical protein
MDTVTDFIRQINALETKQDLEIEARFKGIKCENFMSLLHNFEATPAHTVTVSKSVVSIIRRGTDTGILMHMNFPLDGGKIIKTYREKKIIHHLYENSMGLPFKLTAAMESEIPPCNMNAADIVRVKIRFSYQLPNFPNWIFDLTIMRQLTGSSAENSLGTVVNSMLKPKVDPTTVMNVLNLADYQFEVEAEYKGTSKAPTSDELFSVIQHIVASIDPTLAGGSEYNQYLIEVAKIIGYQKRLHRFTVKELLPQVNLLSKDIYCKNYPPQNFFVTDKADGVRAILLVRGSKLIILSNTLTIVDLENNAPNIICDCELVGSTAYIFDVMQFADPLATEHYGARVAYIERVVTTLKSDRVKGKKVHPMSGEHTAAIEKALETDNRYERDGLIFIQDGQPYLTTKTYKWKPLTQTTIDFLAKKYTYPIASSIKLKDNHDVYFLFNGISSDDFLYLGLRTCENYKKMFPSGVSKSYFPVQFSPSTSPHAYIYQHPSDGPDIDSKVVELKLKSYDVTKLPYLPEWSLERIREDRQADIDSGKYYGNDFRVAELTWNIFLDPLTLDELKNGCSKSYFMETKGTIYFAQTNVLSFVKEKRIEKYAGSPWVIDAACGRGADLGRFLRNKIQNLVCIDQDRTALAELVKRKYDFVRLLRKERKNNKKQAWSRAKGTSVSVIVADMKNRKQVLQKTKSIIPKNGVDVIVCNLAVHYFLESQETLNNFVMICKELLKSGGQLAMMFMIGEALFDALKDTPYGESLDTYDLVLKNSVKKLYKEDTLLPTGQKIGVLLPFAKGEYYEEYLVNTEALTAAFEMHGFTCSKVITVNSSIPHFKHSRPNIYNLLSNDDKWYLDFFGEIVITKN